LHAQRGHFCGPVYASEVAIQDNASRGEIIWPLMEEILMIGQFKLSARRLVPPTV
jgi:hypothetical protein